MLYRCLPTAGGIGDDVYSVGFDGGQYWIGGQAIPTFLMFNRTRRLTRQEEHVISPNQSPTPPRSASNPQSPTPPIASSTPRSSSSPSHTPLDVGEGEESDDPPVNVGDVIGCCLDLERGVASFQKNGISLDSHIEFHHCSQSITPAVSFSAGVR